MKQSFPKVSIIGAGSVGATLAQRVLESGLADIVLLDIAKNLAIGKAFDMLDASPIVGHECSIVGTDDYNQIAGSAIVVITAGLPRKPGMSREDLIAKNSVIVRNVSENVRKYSPEAIVVIVANPLDAMTYLAYKTTGFRRERVMGMAGELDGARFAYLLADELKVSRSSISACMMGSHGDTMVPVLSETFVGGKPVSDLLSREKLDAIIARTRKRGGEIVGLLGSGSAYYSPSAGVFKMIKAILSDSGQTVVVSAFLEGEYGLKGIAIGVPCKMGKSGIKEIVELKMSKEERDAFNASAETARGSISIL
ncbi:MAG: malate dehydrogenase [Candidatus Omnitrophica bacterium]|nr:malate dehydrogenase [Candidatus Omnitrophota bacterium]